MSTSHSLLYYPALRQIAVRIGAAPIILLIGILTPLPVQGGKSLLGMPSLCVFHNITGLPCPGCGITRSVVCCCHLHFADSIRYHPLGFVVFVWLVTAVLLRLPLSPGLRNYLAALPLWLRGAGGLALVGIMFVIWGARLSGWLPSPP